MTRKHHISTQKDMADLEDLARRQGWRTQQRPGGHLEWIAPSGDTITSAMTGTGRSVMNTKALLKGQGMLVDLADVRRYEKARRRVEGAMDRLGHGRKELGGVMPRLMLLLADLIAADGSFDLTCVCGVTKTHPLGFVHHLKACPRAMALATAAGAKPTDTRAEGAVPAPAATTETEPAIPARCDAGHELVRDGAPVKDNVYIWPQGKRWECKICRRADQKTRSHKAPADTPAEPAPTPASPALAPQPEPGPAPPEDPQPEPPLPDLDMRALADTLLAAALEALERPTEEEVEKRIDAAVRKARTDEQAAAEELMNEIIRVTEERDAARREAAAERARANGLEAKARSRPSDPAAERVLSEIARSPRRGRRAS